MELDKLITGGSLKNRTIVFGSIFACLILLIIPNISATQYQLTRDAIEEKIELINITLNEIISISFIFGFLFAIYILFVILICSLFIILPPYTLTLDVIIRILLWPLIYLEKILD